MACKRSQQANESPQTRSPLKKLRVAPHAEDGQFQLQLQPSILCRQQPSDGLLLPFWAALTGRSCTDRPAQMPTEPQPSAVEEISLSLHQETPSSVDVSLGGSLSLMQREEAAGLIDEDTEDSATSSSSCSTSSSADTCEDRQPGTAADEEGDSDISTKCAPSAAKQQQREEQEHKEQQHHITAAAAADPFTFGQRALAVPDLSAWEDIDSAACALLALAELQ